MYNNTVTVENFANVLNSMRAIATNRPLTPEEKALGRKAALIQRDMHRQEAIKAEEDYRNTMIKFYLNQGHTLREALVLIIQSEREALEYNGFGISHRA